MSLSHDTSAGISSEAASSRREPGLLSRVKGMLLAPRTEWLRVARETTRPRRLFLGYVLPLGGLAALSSLARFSAGLHAPPLSIAAMLAFTLCFEVTGVYLEALIIDAMAALFRGVRNQGVALKVAAYAFTPLWLSCVFIPFPAVSVPLQFLSGLYHTYLMYLGLRVLMRSPRDRALGYATTVVLASLIFAIVFTQLSARLADTLHLGHFHAFG